MPRWEQVGECDIMKALKIILAVFCGLILFFFVTCVGCTGLIGAGIAESEKQDSIKKEQIASGEISWEYTTEKDEMGRGDTKLATLPSTDDKFKLIISDSPKGKEIIVSNEDEWFDTNYDANLGRVGYLKAKFDDGQIKTYAFKGPKASVENQAFIIDYAGFLAQLKSAKKLVIEATFINKGDKTITFNVSNLKWEE